MQRKSPLVFIANHLPGKGDLLKGLGDSKSNFDAKENIMMNQAIQVFLIFLLFQCCVGNKKTTAQAKESQPELIPNDEPTEPKDAKNVIYTSFSGYMMSGPGFSIHYERKIDKSLWITTGVGTYPITGDDGKKFDLKLTHLTGKGNSHVELGLGITIGFSKGEAEQVTQQAGTIPAVPPHTDIYPSISLGYRYQKPGVGPIVRFGFGFLEIYVGLGFRF